jgi:hypothetical protein
MIFSLILALATTANAYTIKTTESGEQIRWEDQVVHYQINPDSHLVGESDATEAIRRAFDEWNAVSDVPLYFNYEGHTEDIGTDYTNNNIVSFEDEWSENLDPSLLAITYTWNDNSGKIVAFDVIINQSFKWDTEADPNRPDLQNAMTHVWDATMAATSPNGEISKRTLEDDDIQGVTYLYTGEELEFQQSASCSALSNRTTMVLFIPSILTIFTRRTKND